MTFYQETTSTSDSYQLLHEEEAGAFGHINVCQDVATGAIVAVKYLKRVSTACWPILRAVALCVYASAQTWCIILSVKIHEVI